MGAAVVIAPRRDLAIIAVQGPYARSKVWQAMPGSQTLSKSLKPFQAVEIGTLFISRTGYTGEDGFEIMMPASAAPFLWKSLAGQAVAPIGLGARDTLRLEAGMNLYGQDMDEDTSPLEAGLAWTVDLDSPRDFIGKAVLVASKPARHALGLALIDRGVMRSHQKVMTKHGDGEITSGSFGPTLERSIALVRVPVAVKPCDEVEVEVRGKCLRARVVKPPFVRHGNILIDT
jgi:aminomethyltransferase